MENLEQIGLYAAGPAQGDGVKVFFVQIVQHYRPLLWERNHLYTGSGVEVF